MIFRSIHTSVGSPFPGIWQFNIFLGAALICFGVLIILMPELLALLVAGGLIFVGVTILAIGLRLKSAARNIKPTIVDPYDI